MKRADGLTMPAGLTPRRLSKLSAEKFADMLVCRALPVIELYFCEDSVYQSRYFPNREYILKYLRSLKTWFWQSSDALLGVRDSILRKLVDIALTDVLCYHSEFGRGQRDQQLFTIFIFQLLFQPKAGTLTTKGVFVIDHLCKNVGPFLDHLSPLHVTSLDLTTLIFADKAATIPWLKHTPQLRFIKLHMISSKAVLRSLRRFCPEIEEIEIKCNHSSLPSDSAWIENELCRLFFCGLSKGVLLEVAATRLECPDLSFPNLKAVALSVSCCNNVNNFALLLKCFYPSLKTKWTKVIKEATRLHRSLECGMPYAEFAKENSDFHWNVLSFLPLIPNFPNEYDSSNSDDNDNDGDNVSNSKKNSSITITKADFIEVEFFENLVEPSEYLEEIIKLVDCQNLRIWYSFMESSELLHVLGQAYNSLSKLYLIGPVFNARDADHLCGVLRRCVNLTVLALGLDLVSDPGLRNLGEMPNLEVLSLNLKNYLSWMFRRPTDEFVEERGLHLNLPAYIHRDEPNYGIFHENLSSDPAVMPHEESACKAPEPDEKDASFDERPQSLKDKIFGVGPLKYDLYSDSEYNDFGETSNEPSVCGYMEQPFIFYNKRYGYEITDSLTKKGSEDGLDGENSSESSGNDRINNLNCSRAAMENTLQQWRLEMDFDAPVNLLRSLLVATPNLKVLEIPDLRFYDVSVLFENEIIVKNLAKVHTLQLSSQFTYQLAKAVANFPSLKTIRIAPGYGVDNFLRFKRKLRNSNIDIELGQCICYDE